MGGSERSSSSRHRTRSKSRDRERERSRDDRRYRDRDHRSSRDKDRERDRERDYERDYYSSRRQKSKSNSKHSKKSKYHRSSSSSSSDSSATSKDSRSSHTSRYSSSRNSKTRAPSSESNSRSAPITTSVVSKCILDTIEEDSFKPKAFFSTKDREAPEKSEKVIIDLNAETVTFPMPSEFSLEASSKEEIFQQNFLGDQEQKQEKWIRKLLMYRQKYMTE